MTLAENVKADIALVWDGLERAGLAGELRALQRPRTARSLGYVGLSWALILAAWLAVIHLSWMLLPLALLAMATGQRFLGNNLHDASHGNFSHRGNAALGRWLLAPPMFEDFRRYLRLHMEHHRFLGDRALDPDFLELPPGRGASPLRAFGGMLLSPRRWAGSVLGDLPALGAGERLRIGLWWAALLGALGLLAGALPALGFAALWLGARATTYHGLKTFTELADHGGLPIGGIFSYTRNSPASPLSLLLHPRHDNFHLTHHLVPRVPMASLARAHRILRKIPVYQYAHHCRAYFLGPDSVVRGWIEAGPEPAPVGILVPALTSGPRPQ